MKRILSVILSILMAASCAYGVFAADDAGEPAVADEAVVTESASDPHAEAVEFLEEKGILKGRADHELALEEPIKRYEMAIFIARLLTGWYDDSVWKEDGNTANYTVFTDLEGSGAVNYLGAIRYTEGKKIIEGYGDGRFGPEDGITYQDAMTMIVRALGYDGLSYPWGYIEQGIDLDLELGIENTPWTVALKRGEVAQLLYNAIFAPMKDGKTLYYKLCGVDIAQKTVVIVSSHDATLLPTDHKTEENRFQIAFVDEETGEIGSTNYTLAIEDHNGYMFDIETDEEAADKIGYVYKASFAVKDGAVSDIVKWNEIQLDTLWNSGRLNPYDVDEFLKTVDIETKYGYNRYLGTHEPGKPQILVRSGSAVEFTYDVDTEFYKYAMDWKTGDIYELVEKKNDKTDLSKVYLVGQNEKNAYAEYVYSKTPVWYWDSNANLYFRFRVATDKPATELGIETMTREDMRKLYKERLRVPQAGSGRAVITKINQSAYSSLELFDVKGGTKGDWGLYQEYGIAVYDGDKGFTPVCGTIADAYKLVTGKDYKPATVKADRVVLDPSIQADIKAPSKGDYVICNVDSQTKTARIVKVIGKSFTDENNYVGHGVLRAYTVSENKVVLNAGITTERAAAEDLTLYFDYDNLLGGKLKTPGTDEERHILNTYFGSLHNQYVTYVVVDGRLVDIFAEKTNASATSFLVERYAGVGSDGTIVILGYNLSNFNYGFFRISTINGWAEGDAFHYEPKDGRYCIFKTESYDAETDTYFVSGRPVEVGPNARRVRITGLGGDAAGITNLIRNPDGTTTDDEQLIRLTGTERYLIVDGREGAEEPILVYAGKLPADWILEGYEITDDVYYVDDTGRVPVFDKLKNLFEYVVFFEYDANTTEYDLWQTDEVTGEDWYLRGATVRVVYCRSINSLTTASPYKAVNQKLENGKIYRARNGFIIDEAKEANLHEIVARYAGSNRGDNFKYDYLKTKDVALTTKTDPGTGLELFSEEVISPKATKESEDFAEGGVYHDLIDSMNVFFIDGMNLVSMNGMSEEDFHKAVGDAQSVPFFFVYQIDGECTVYIFKDDIQY